MHVALYHETAGSRHAGGIAVYVREAAVALAADHEVTLLTGPGDPPDRLRAADVRVVRLSPRPTGDGVADVAGRLPAVSEQAAEKLRLFAAGLRSGALRRAAREADLVWTHQYLDDLLVSQVATPTVYQYHGVQSVGGGARARERLSRTDVHLANSAPTAVEVRDRLGRAVDGVLRPGVALDRFRPDADPAFDGESPVVLFVGRLTEAKGAFDLVDAVARVEDLRCRFVGRGRADALRARARARGVANRVAVVGSISHADLPGHYVAADVVCVPAHYESFGMANLEAMACGTPIVATEACRAPAVREAASLVPAADPAALADELATLVASPERRADLAAAGRETARRHSWARRADRFADLCEPLVG